MTIRDLNELSTNLNEIKAISSKQPYELVTKLNIPIIKAQNIVAKERRRLQDQDLSVDSPQIIVLDYEKAMEQQAYKDLNENLQQLVEKNFKITDYGLLYKDAKTLQLFIKYTS